jgi:hypothetical protein
MRGTDQRAPRGSTRTGSTTTTCSTTTVFEETTMYGQLASAELARHRQQDLLRQGEQSRRSAVFTRRALRRRRAVVPAAVRRGAPRSA